MVTTIGIDPHKATHTAVAIDESEVVLGEITLPADRSQLQTLLDWADRVDGDGRLWAVEAADWAICCLSSWSLPVSEWSKCHLSWLPGSACWGQAGRTRTTRTMLCRWRSPLSASRHWPRCVVRTTPRS
jgi:hypothetical protein